MPLNRHKTIRQALSYVDRNPDWPEIQRLDMPIWELISRNLFDIANHPNTKVRGSLARATRAQRILLDRLTGTRRQGTNPAVRNSKSLQLLDLTKDLTEGQTNGEDSAREVG
ncbi:hypothetical protein SEA_YELLOWPANDA_53 [Microbacterium phage YellowPanda]|uniref:Uncharacterized protein n=2 Tax=Tinytimothyvirus tinytimothy TaxID=2845596 RepID=A0A5Q2WJM6_9CAUD|nr:hypothetical protein HWC33_gp50 [Microbacterium phage TinyTimothy]QDF17003.1 hypothetical protein SEA_TINYTIMOTHY_50 [Microbacterium phage TinyTimothy]QGH78692.1 hypothetical protein SEA_WESAK_51 [Microbacterium phage Wesak]